MLFGALAKSFSPIAIVRLAPDKPVTFPLVGTNFICRLPAKNSKSLKFILANKGTVDSGGLYSSLSLALSQPGSLEKSIFPSLSSSNPLPHAGTDTTQPLKPAQALSAQSIFPFASSSLPLSQISGGGPPADGGGVVVVAGGGGTTAHSGKPLQAISAQSVWPLLLSSRLLPQISAGGGGLGGGIICPFLKIPGLRLLDVSKEKIV